MTLTDVLYLEASIPPLAFTLALSNERAGDPFRDLPARAPLTPALGGAAGTYPPRYARAMRATPAN